MSDPLKPHLGGLTATKMGLERVSHMAGGFGAWRDAGGTIDAGTGEFKM